MILYVACTQFVLLVFFNIPLLFANVTENWWYHFFGMYELPKYETHENYRLTTYFWERLVSVIVDLMYIIILTWMVYA